MGKCVFILLCMLEMHDKHWECTPFTLEQFLCSSDSLLIQLIRSTIICTMAAYCYSEYCEMHVLWTSEMFGLQKHFSVYNTNEKCSCWWLPHSYTEPLHRAQQHGTKYVSMCLSLKLMYGHLRNTKKKNNHMRHMDNMFLLFSHNWHVGYIFFSSGWNHFWCKNLNGPIPW